MREIREGGDGRGLRFAVVASAFNEVVTARLLDGARAGFRAGGVADGDLLVAWVPGAFELPLVARTLAREGRYDAVVCLGAVIRGETPHFDLVAGEAARGVAAASADTGVPVLFGVLTTESMEQAMDRAGGRHGNKGYDAAVAAIQMARVLARLAEEAGPAVTP